jgi:hypothetical protein
MAVIPEAASGDTFTAAQANSPFYVESAAYDSSADTLNITVGPGRVDFDDGSTVYEQTADQTVTVAGPAASETYYVYVAASGVSARTGSTAGIGEIRLGSVTLASDKTVDSVDDLRGLLPVPYEAVRDQAQTDAFVFGLVL